MREIDVIVIHGGETFDTYDAYMQTVSTWRFETLYDLESTSWKKTLRDQLPPGFRVFLPEMPNKYNAKYTEWEMWFDKISPLLTKETILVGHSLGGIFLIKYLATHDISTRIIKTILISAPFDSTDVGTLADFSLDDINTERVLQNTGELHVFHSDDDMVVPCAHSQKYAEIFSGTRVHILTDRGHFNREDFPELVEEIQNI